MYCQNCGFKNDDEFQYCSNCGIKLEELESVISEETNQTKYKLSRLNIVLLAEGLALLLLTVLICFVYMKSNSPIELAKKYITAWELGNWSAAYDATVYADDSTEGLSKKDFISVCKMNGWDDNRAAKNGQVKITGAQQTAGSAKSKSIQVSYISGGITDATEVSMIKGKNGWKVENPEVSSKDAWLAVPAGSEVKIDKRSVSAAKVDKKDSKYDYYNVKDIFDGTHYVQVSAEGRQPVDALLSLDAGSEESPILINMDYSAERLEALKTQAAKDIKEIYQAAIDNKDAKEVEAVKSAQGNAVSKAYKGVQDAFHTSYVDCISMQLTEGEMDVSVYKNPQGDDVFEVKYYAKMKSKYNDYGIYGDSDDVKEKTGNVQPVISYIYKDNKFVMTELAWISFHFL